MPIHIIFVVYLGQIFRCKIVFIQHTLLLLYVDDMIITGDDLQDIFYFKSFLKQNFDMKDLGLLSFFLGLEISYDQFGYYLSQVKYASDLVCKLDRF